MRLLRSLGAWLRRGYWLLGWTWNYPVVQYRGHHVEAMRASADDDVILRLKLRMDSQPSSAKRPVPRRWN